MAPWRFPSIMYHVNSSAWPVFRWARPLYGPEAPRQEKPSIFVLLFFEAKLVWAGK